MEWEYELQPTTGAGPFDRRGKRVITATPAARQPEESDPTELQHLEEDLSRDPDPAEMREVRARHAQRLAIGIPAAQEWARQRLETR